MEHEFEKIMDNIIKDIIYINEKKAFLTSIHKKKLATIIEKANNNKELSNKDYFYISEMKKRIKIFLVSNEMRVTSKLNRIIRQPLTVENKQRKSTFKKGRTSFSGYYSSNGSKL